MEHISSGPFCRIRQSIITISKRENIEKFLLVNCSANVVLTN
jgi:hypothetical protein